MSTMEFIHDNHSRATLLFIFGATFVVMSIICVLIVTVSLPGSWTLLPASWWVGAMMVWGLEKRRGIL